MTEQAELFRANPDHVRMIMDHLRDAHNAFCEAHPEFSERDDFMGIHNFHVGFILSFEHQYRLNSEMQLFIRKMAADTFTKAMEDKPAYSQQRRRPK